MTPMEVALLSAVMKPAINKLASLIASEFESILGVTKDLCDLQGLFGDITAWLSGVEVRTADSSSSPYWLKQLKAVVNDFDDLLYRLEAEKDRADIIASENHGMANWLWTKPKSVLSRTKIAQEIKEIRKRFAKIVKQRTEFSAIADSTLVTHHVKPTHNTTGEMSILTNTTYVVGRDEVKQSIMSMLVEAHIQERIPIVSIVGLGGSGKTTLAKYICQDGKIIGEHFEVVYWVHVSQEFNVEKLLRKLFESVSDEKSELHTLQHMSRKISEKLSTRKFLLVLDDVWNEGKHDWEQFEQHLCSGAPGSKILLTTRGKNVAEAVKSVEVVNLAVLSDDDSWKLFQRSSGWTEEGLDSEFIEVGKQIVKKCAGMPLAIKSLAGNLHGKREIKEWRSFRDSNLLTNKDIQHRVLESLKLSYFHLSDDLKQCFVLCCIFPKGYCIDKDHLISQWITHGFVNSSDGSRQLEDIGTGYFNSLLKVSFLQDLVERHHYGRVIVTCKMHDLVHDLSRQILQDEILLTPKKSTSGHDQICRYLSFSQCAGKVESKLFNKLRALFVTGDSFTTDKPIKKGYCVRSIILENTWGTSVPSFISKFEYLGYLRISNSRCKELPEAVMDCWNLQAIHLTRCLYLATLPESIGKLRKLRILEVSGAGSLQSLPQSIDDCHNLEFLHLDECSNLNNVPDSLCKNKKLRLLDILECYALPHLPSETFGLLPNLHTINLSGCSNLEVLPDPFASDQLRTLKLPWLTKLTALPESIACLSNLEHLDLESCSGLLELPEGIVNLKRLVVLNLQGCYGLRGLPAGFGQLTRLETLGLFVIGESSEHARISELGSLDRLSGELKLTIVKVTDDAEKAYLKRKNNIHELDLWFGNMGDGIEQEAAGMEQEMAVLNVLEPPYGIKVMKIQNYKGLHLPCWLTRKTHWSNKFEQTVDLPHFPLLTRMSLGPLPSVMHLTGLVHLPSLRSLHLSNFDTLESINIGPFPSLTSLIIDYMPGSLEWTTEVRAILGGVTVCDNQEAQCCFPRLTDLFVFGCPKLNVNPCFPTSLKTLTLQNSIVWPVHPQADNLVSLDSVNSNWVSSCSTLVNKSGIGKPSCTSDWEFLQHLLALKFLSISRRDEELTQLPESMRSLTTLKQLSIHECPGLRLLPVCLGELTSLQNIEISDCENLNDLPEGIQHLTSLQELKLTRCSVLYQLPEVGLGGLRSLVLGSLHRLSRLPESMRGLTSLQKLEINRCDALHQLPEWLGELPSLCRLRIASLPLLTGLPESLQGLTSLRSLGVHNCAALHRLPDKLGELRFLTELHINKLPALTCLPESMQGLTSLHLLSITDCDALTSLPESVGQLCALSTLRINNCRGLTSLPRSIQRLTALESLFMTGNPHLFRRYGQGAGKDGHLISHVRYVLITA
ncbi:unnamed protein product [Alopecurus aequalis]